MKQGVNITLKGNSLSVFPPVITLSNCQGDAPTHNSTLTFQLACDWPQPQGAGEESLVQV